MDSKEIRSELNEIRKMVHDMAAIPEEHRIVAYRKVDLLFLKLEGYLSKHPELRASDLLDEIKMNVISLARLEETAGEPETVYTRQVDSLIEDIASILCP